MCVHACARVRVGVCVCVSIVLQSAKHKVYTIFPANIVSTRFLDSPVCLASSLGKELFVFWTVNTVVTVACVCD